MSATSDEGSSFSDFAEVAPGLFVGAHPEPEDPFELGATVVVCLTTGTSVRSVPPDSVLVHWPIEDGPVPEPETLRGLASFVTACLRSEAVVYIHCQAGMNRSALVTARVLMEQGMSAEQAIAAVRAQRRGSLSDEYADWLRLEERAGSRARDEIASFDEPAEEHPAGTLGAALLDWTPSPLDLVDEVRARSPSHLSPLHGEEHWRAVTHAGLAVGAVTPGADLRLVFLFGLLHDSMRWNEWGDPEHGERAAARLHGLVEDGRLRLPAEAHALLASACRLHSQGATSSDPTVGTCWDADRLNLVRLGMVPAPTLMSTDEGRKPERVGWVRAALREVPTWSELLATNL